MITRCRPRYARSLPLRVVARFALLIFLMPLAALPQAGPPPDTRAEQPGTAPPATVPDSAATTPPAPSGATSPATTAASTAPKVDPYATEFLRLCSGCHTIGGGVLTGPDLIAASKWPRDDRRVAVKRMEKNVGPLTPQQVDGLADFLGSPDVQAKLQAAKQARVEEMAATIEPGVPANGRALFFGAQPLSAGGIGCFSCHSVAGRGGNMAKDLSDVYRRLGEQSVLSTAQQPAFPMMKAAYATKPVTAQEAAHLAAFFKTAAAAVPAGATAPPANQGLVAVHAGAGVLLLIVLGVAALASLSLRAGVRARLVRDSFRR